MGRKESIAEEGREALEHMRPCDHVKDFDLYSKSNRKPLKDFMVG